MCYNKYNKKGAVNMGDIFKKIQEIDEKNIDKNDPFMDKCLEDYKKANDMIKSILPDKTNSTFNSDLNMFNEACTKFINYIKQFVENPNEVYVLYMLRNGNSIDYGKYEKGIRRKKDTIEMISDEDLRKLYKLLQAEFVSNFTDGCKHTFGEGWSLNPTIGENVMIDINSYNSYDKNWFYEESHKEQKSDSPKKR